MRTGTPNLTCAGESCRTWPALVRTARERSGARPQLANAATASSAHRQRVVGRGRAETRHRTRPLTIFRNTFAQDFQIRY